MEPTDIESMQDTGAGLGPVTATMVEHLRGTRPWVLLISIMGFIGAGLMVAMAFAMVVAGSFAPELGVAGAVGLAVFYLVAALIYVAISYYLFRFAGSIREIGGTGGAAALERALEYQKSFWRLLGIMTVAYLGVIVLILLVALVAGIAASG